ncbi:YigZ family protein [Halomonas sediminis]
MRFLVPHLSPGTWHSADIEVEKSRFITWVTHAPSPAEPQVLLRAACTAHPNASHHCSAFIAGPPGEQNHIGFSDDGEPGGTAGRPMFQVLEGSSLGQVGCVVTRYFGGTKLGTGGLARAYAQAVSAALVDLPTKELVERRRYGLQLPFAGEAEARAWLAEQAIPITEVSYDAQGAYLTIGWPSDHPLDLSPLENRLKSSLSYQDLDTKK